MEGMTVIEGVPDSTSARPGMAFFCGTGPAGKTCGDCIHRGYKREGRKGTWSEKLQQEVYRNYQVQKCAVFKKMAGKHGQDVDADNPSCKYFQQKPKD